MEKRCKVCGAALYPSDRYCTACGQELPPVRRPDPRWWYAHNSMPRETAEPQLGVPELVLMLTVLCIPVVGLVFGLLWGFGSRYTGQRRYIARAMLVVSLLLWGMLTLMGLRLLGIIMGFFLY